MYASAMRPGSMNNLHNVKLKESKFVLTKSNFLARLPNSFWSPFTETGGTLFILESVYWTGETLFILESVFWTGGTLFILESVYWTELTELEWSLNFLQSVKILNL